MRSRLNAGTILIIVVGFVASILWASGGFSGEGKKGPAPEALKNVGPTLAKAYKSEPFNPAMPDHIWMDAGNGHAVFLHFNKPVTDSTANVIFVGEGIKGRFCVEDQPDAGKTGFVHFHRSNTPKGETGPAAHGHGGKSGEEGYWLKHIAVSEFEMMGMRFTPGTAMNFMPTPAPRCG